MDRDIKIIRDQVSKQILIDAAKQLFGDFVKAVVDVEKGIMAIGGELHADAEKLLLEDGSRKEDLWGINLWVEKGDDWIGFNSMINVKPLQGNKTRGIESEEIKQKIHAVIEKLILP